jgi:hypothetical protein
MVECDFSSGDSSSHDEHCDEHEPKSEEHFISMIAFLVARHIRSYSNCTLF